MDVKNAFLHGDLDEVVYTCPPQGISGSKLLMYVDFETLYGLKQAPCAWFAKFRSTILKAVLSKADFIHQYFFGIHS